METRKRKFPDEIIDVKVNGEGEDNISLSHENPPSDVRASLLNAYQPLLLKNRTPNEEAIKQLKMIKEETCRQYLHALFVSFCIENLKFYGPNANSIGVEIKNNSTEVKHIINAATKLIPLVAHRNDLTLKIEEVGDQQSNPMKKFRLLCTFPNPHSKEELQNIFGRLALIQRIVMKNLLRWVDVAKLMKGLQPKEDIVIKIIDYIVALGYLNRLNELEKNLPNIILQMLNGDYSYQTKLSPVFEQLPTAEKARSTFKTFGELTQELIFKQFFNVFKSNIFQFGSNPNEINILNITPSYIKSAGFLNHLKLLFSITNPHLIDQLQMKLVENTLSPIVILRYQEGQLKTLIEALARSVWLSTQGAKHGRVQRIFGYLIESIKKEKDFITTIETREHCKFSSNAITIIIKPSTEAKPLLSDLHEVLVVPQQDYSGSTSFIRQTLFSAPSGFKQPSAPPTIEIPTADNDPLLSDFHEEEVPQPEVDTATPCFSSDETVAFSLTPAGSEAVQQVGLFPANDERDEEDVLRFLSPEGLDHLVGPNKYM
ncbi:MAG: hypothetical protein A3F12_03235 [Gammaproteobacteria bacterium RIFCSPHIGHO2_12_FULL_38_14]|nr:MAG: hypothetical protein A3F12_03235 [Gammaproteobacteria bacterium RIFCSPHIGHO2_12_FULL_38_14]